jgi:glyoxalase family protein
MSGIHHVTAIAGRPNVNFDFYTRTLGLRFVKKTVNFDDPGTYHFYYGDEAGNPGTILTFFPWEHAAPGRVGVGQAQTTAFRIPAQSIGFWAHRLVEAGAKHEAPIRRFGEVVLEFTDPDGMGLSLIGVPGAENEPAWTTDGIPAEHAIRGFHGVTLMLDSVELTAAILTDVLGFTRVGQEGPYVRFKSEGAVGGIVDIREAKGFLPGRMGRGSVHHVAFRAKDDAEQAEIARKLSEVHGIYATEQRDRQYFRSIYFREPGGILFEIATDAPGFTVDEPIATLGTDLKLPRFLESKRQQIEAVLPTLEVAA